MWDAPGLQHRGATIQTPTLVGREETWRTRLFPWSLCPPQVSNKDLLIQLLSYFIYLFNSFLISLGSQEKSLLIVRCCLGTGTSRDLSPKEGLHSLWRLYGSRQMSVHRKWGGLRRPHSVFGVYREFYLLPLCGVLSHELVGWYPNPHSFFSFIKGKPDLGSSLTVRKGFLGKGLRFLGSLVLLDGSFTSVDSVPGRLGVTIPRVTWGWGLKGYGGDLMVLLSRRNCRSSR